MPIRLSKALKELNVGMDIAVEFLAKKGHKVAADLNVKLEDDLYLFLAKEFNKDMALKMEAERLTQERLSKEKERIETLAVETPKPVAKKEPELVKVSISANQQPHVKVVGDIKDLRQPAEVPVAQSKEAEKPKEQPQVKQEIKPVVIEPKQETTKPQEIKVEKNVQTVEKPAETKPAETKIVETQKPVSKAIKQEEKKQVQQQPTVLHKEEKKTERPQQPQPQEQEQPKVQQQQKNVQQLPKHDKPVEKIAEARPDKKEPEIFNPKLKFADKEKEELNKFKSQVENAKIIDLKAINDKTRPKKKSRRERERERKEKAKQQKIQQQQQQSQVSVIQKKGDNNVTAQQHKDSKKKRERFKTSKIDISKGDFGAKPQQQDVGGAVKSNTSSGGGKGGGKKFIKRPVIDEEAVQKQVKEQLARLQSGNKFAKKGVEHRRDKREKQRNREEEKLQLELSEEKNLKLTEFVTVSELAAMMNKTATEVIGTLFKVGIMATINQRLDAEYINLIAEEFGFTTQFVSADVVESIGDEEPDKEEDLLPRAPVVTVMGHVDHGKTSLLDYIRKTNVIAGEAGGITQHIGAYNVKLESGKRVTFLDTPGHEAFTAMRARGAKLTDIAIIIVAADDNVMPQTSEAINHASAAGVPMVFAINKIDKAGANPEKIKETLAQMNYLVEEWGGKYQSQDISAKKGMGVAELLEKVLLEAEMLELKANPNRKAVGSVIESSLDKGRGYVATVLVQNGTLNQGDVVIAGTHYGKIKAMFNERNQRIKTAKPAEPVLILGLNGAPQAGDNFNVMASEHEAREITSKREQLQREQTLRTRKHFTLDELGRRIALGDFQELNVIVKGDVDGSVEALSDSLLKLSTERIQINVIHKAVGAISDSDVLLAAASNAIICGFQVRPIASARKLAEKEEIDIRLYSVIYDAIEELKSAMEGMLTPETKEEITATIEVLEVFNITKVGKVAGCLVREGKVKRNNKLRLVRDGIVVHTGEIDALKRMKDDVKEVGTNFECGISIKNYNDIKTGDIIETFEEVEVKKSL